MSLILLRLLGIALAGYVLGRRLPLGPGPRWLLSLQLGLVGAPALTWITGIMIDTTHPDRPVWILALVGGLSLASDLRRDAGYYSRLRLRAAIPYLTAALLLGAAQCTLVATSGWRDGDLQLAVFHQKDGALHLAISAMLRPGEDFSHGWPPEDPLISGRPLVNYHPLSDVLVALLAPHEDHVLVYFRLLPPLYCLLFSLGVAWTMREWGASTRVGVLAMILAVTTSSFGHLVYPWIPGKGPFLESRFWMSQPFSMLYNPPFALSLGSLFAVLAVLSRRGAPSWPVALVAGILLGLGFSVKAFLTVVVLPAMIAAAIAGPREDRGTLVRSAALVALGVLLMIKLSTSGAGSFLIWDPGWPLRTMPGRLGLPSSPGILMLCLFYFVGNLGIRSLALPDLWPAFRSGRSGNCLAASAAVISLTLPLAFSMGGVYYNGIQFAYYGLALLPLWLAPRLDPWIFEGSRIRRFSIILSLVALSLPGTIATMWFSNFGTRIEREEVESLRALGRTVPEGSAIVVPPGLLPGRVAPGRKTGFVPPQGAMESAYVPALAARACYLTDPFNVGVRMIPYQDRLDEIGRAFPDPASPPPVAWMEARRIGAAWTGSGLSMQHFDDAISPRRGSGLSSRQFGK